MTAWDTCSECGKASTSGMIVCYDCASRIIEEKRRAGIPIRRVVIDGETHTAPDDSHAARDLPRAVEKKEVHCPCGAVGRRDSLGNFYCRNCGYKDSLT